MRKIWFGVLAVTFAVGIVGCSGDGPNGYDVKGIGPASEREYHECILVQKYEIGTWGANNLGPGVIYCQED